MAKNNSLGLNTKPASTSKLDELEVNDLHDKNDDEKVTKNNKSHQSRFKLFKNYFKSKLSISDNVKREESKWKDRHENVPSHNKRKKRKRNFLKVLLARPKVNEVSEDEGFAKTPDSLQRSINNKRVNKIDCNYSSDSLGDSLDSTVLDLEDFCNTSQLQAHITDNSLSKSKISAASYLRKRRQAHVQTQTQSQQMEPIEEINVNTLNDDHSEQDQKLNREKDDDILISNNYEVKNKFISKSSDNFNYDEDINKKLELSVNNDDFKESDNNNNNSCKLDASLKLNNRYSSHIDQRPSLTITPETVSLLKHSKSMKLESDIFTITKTSESNSDNIEPIWRQVALRKQSTWSKQTNEDEVIITKEEFEEIKIVTDNIGKVKSLIKDLENK